MAQEKLDDLHNADNNSDLNMNEENTTEGQKISATENDDSKTQNVVGKNTTHEDDKIENNSDSKTKKSDSEIPESLEEKKEEFRTIPILNYSKMSLEELYEEISNLVKKEQVQFIKPHVDQIRESFFNLINKDKKDKEAKFIEEGGNIIDFRYDNYIKKQFNIIYNDYRSKREAFLKKIEQMHDKNYSFRNELIEELKSLINKEERIADTVKEFRKIQEKWRNAGQVAKSKSSDLWKNYHHHVENFYDYLHLNDEMRDLDFKHNLEEKNKIIYRAEALAKEPSIKKAFDELQLLHKLWKEDIGPVAKEYREEIWQKFSAATKIIHDRKHQNIKELKVEWAKNLIAKKELCEKIKEVAEEEGNSHSQWQNRIKKIEQLKSEFLSTGHVAKNETEKIWQLFKDATKEFNKKKNSFYKELKDVQIINLEKKNKLVQIAESLKDSNDWKNTANTLKKIQSDWKKIGHVPKQHSDEVWNKFRNSCNHFFDRLTEHHKELDSKFEDNYNNKKKLLENIKSIELPKDTKEAVTTLKEYINNWKALGVVPRNKRELENDFNLVIDSLFDKLNLDRTETNLIKFKNRIDSFLASDDVKKIYHERDIVRKKIDEIKKEVLLLENNLGFFNVSDDNPLIKDVKQKIETYKKNLALWKKKLDYLREI